MEMKENIYPKLPTAPPIEDQGSRISIAKNKRNSNVSRTRSSDHRSFK